MLTFSVPDLYDNLVQVSSVYLTLADLMKICVHVARGCTYLEEMHFVHRYVLHHLMQKFDQCSCFN